MLDPRIDILLRNLDQAFDQRSWHGPNLMNSIRGVDPEEAAWRPTQERHNVWELVLHAAYWKYRVCRLLSKDSPRSFDRKGSNFFERPTVDEANWQGDVEILKAWHQRLRAIVTALDPERLDQTSARSEYNDYGLISGVAFHDIYHAGQIRLLRRMRSG